MEIMISCQPRVDGVTGIIAQHARKLRPNKYLLILQQLHQLHELGTRPQKNLRLQPTKHQVKETILTIQTINSMFSIHSYPTQPPKTRQVMSYQPNSTFRIFLKIIVKQASEIKSLVLKKNCPKTQVHQNVMRKINKKCIWRKKLTILNLKR